MDLRSMAIHSREAAWALAPSSQEQRNQALLLMADCLIKHQDDIFSANEKDMKKAEQDGLAAPLLHRLKFGSEKLKQVVLGLKETAALPDPIGQTTLSRELTEGLKLYRVTCPIGVIGVIFESRPDALVQIASLCLKSGNAVLLKGGREALLTNGVLCECLREAAQLAGLPRDFAQLLETREDVAKMLKQDDLIDLIIPRGSNSFVRYILDNSRIPVLGHSDGICHVYIDQCFDPGKALRVIVDSKTQNVSVCNATETLLIHENAAQQILPVIADALRAKSVTLKGDEKVCQIIDCLPASEEDWRTEYLDYILSIRIVSSLDEAIKHINQFGSHHTDSIVTENKDTAAAFMNRIDSAGVYWNVSTRFADGFVYGFGAEVGIATGKIHARGPMGLDGLTTYKYKLIGNGNTLAEMKDGTRSYTHHLLDEECPL